MIMAVFRRGSRSDAEHHIRLTVMPRDREKGGERRGSGIEWERKGKEAVASGRGSGRINE